MDYFEELVDEKSYTYGLGLKKASYTIMMTRCDAGYELLYPLPDPDFLKKEYHCIVTQELNAKEEDLEILSQSLPNVLKKEAPGAILEGLKQELKAVEIIQPQKIIEKVRNSTAKKEDIEILPQLPEEISIFAKVEDWLSDKLFNYQVKTIKGIEWEGVLQKIAGVSIRSNSGSSHFEVLNKSRVVGGFFRCNEYAVGYKKWLQEIILDLGYVVKK